MNDPNLAVVVLAAGRGTRMKSDLPKVLHPLAGRPLLAWVLAAARQVDPARLLVVVGYQAEAVRRAVDAPDMEFVIQEEQRGTGHAVLQCREALQDFDGHLLILCGDMPLLQGKTLQRLRAHHLARGAACTLLTLKTQAPRDFGRVIRDAEGRIQKIVEARDLSAAEKTVDEYNSGVYCFQKDLLFNSLADLRPDNDQGELYLTDTLEILVRQGHPVETVVTTDEAEIFGINSVDDLKRAERLAPPVPS